MGRGLQKPAKDGEAAVDVPSLVRSLSRDVNSFYQIDAYALLGNG